MPSYKDIKINVIGHIIANIKYCTFIIVQIIVNDLKLSRCLGLQVT